MPLTQDQTNQVLREYNDFVSSRPDPSNDPVPYSKLDVRNALSAVDARIDTVLPSILNQVPASFRRPTGGSWSNWSSNSESSDGIR